MIGIGTVINQRRILRELVVHLGQRPADAVLIGCTGCDGTKIRAACIHLFFQHIQIFQHRGRVAAQGTQRVPFRRCGAIIGAAAHEIIRIVAHLRNVGLDLFQALVAQRKGGQSRRGQLALFPYVGGQGLTHGAFGNITDFFQRCFQQVQTVEQLRQALLMLDLRVSGILRFTVCIIERASPQDHRQRQGKTGQMRQGSFFQSRSLLCHSFSEMF